MAEIPRLHLDSGSSSIEMNGLRENPGAQKIWVSDQMGNGRTESFIVDMESFSNGGGNDSDVPTNSRITLQRYLSRKGSHRGAGDRDSLPVSSASSSSSPRGGQTGPSSTPEKASINSQSPAAVKQQHNHHHQITVNTGNVISENRWGRRCNSFRRSSSHPAWFSDPKRVLLFFATLSSVGTMLLICFALAVGKPYDNDSGKDWLP